MAVKVLYETIEKGDLRFQLVVVIALYELGEREWARGEEAREKVPGIIELLRDEDIWVVNDAAEVLGHIRDKRAVKPLIYLLGRDDIDEDIRWTVAEALQRITGKDFELNQKRWLKWLKGKVKIMGKPEPKIKRRLR